MLNFRFLTPRPWWKVTKEPYESTSLKHHSHSLIIFDRVYYGWENYFKFLASVQFVDNATCRNSSALYGRNTCRHPGWFSVLGKFNSMHSLFLFNMHYLLAFYTMKHEVHPYSIHNVYVPKFTDKVGQQRNSFISDQHCPPGANQWNCAFLPQTFCPIPEIIRNCTVDKVSFQ